jgi:erythromycin esterase-like protein
MFDNVLWALQREGNQGRVAIWAHNAHISKKSVPGDLSTLAGVFGAGPRLGMFLDALLGPKYVSIGTTFYEGQSGWQPQQGPATCGMIDWELNRVGPPLFILSMPAAGRAKVADEWFTLPALRRNSWNGAKHTHSKKRVLWVNSEVAYRQRVHPHSAMARPLCQHCNAPRFSPS